jgi:hypothetical protein
MSDTPSSRAAITMPHVTDDDLVLLYYGELADTGKARAHLAECASCRANLDELNQVLRFADAASVPVRDETYGRAVWQAIAPRLDSAAPSSWWSTWLAAWRGRRAPRQLMWPQAGLATAIAGLLTALVFVDGPPPPEATTVSSGDAAVIVDEADTVDRVLVSAVSDHLERASMLFTEVNQAETAADVEALRDWAGDLTTANRLYRRSAQFSGDERLAQFLDDLERVLVEVSHVGEHAASDPVVAIREQLDTEGEAFRLRVASAELRARTQLAAASVAGDIGL